VSIRVEDNKLLALILHLKEMLLQRESSKIVKAKPLGLAPFVISHDQVFGLLGRAGRAGFFLLLLALDPALRFFSLLFLAGALLLPLGEGGTRISGHECS